VERAFDTWKLVSLSPLPVWALAGLAVATVAGVVLAILSVRKEPSNRRKWTLWLLRIVAGVCALFFLLEPGLRRLQVARMKSRVAVLVDRSASMGFPVESKGQSRSAQAADELDALAPEMDAQRDRYAFELYGFDPELSPVNTQSIRNQPPRGGRTDLLAALRAAATGQGGSTARKLSGILLFTDGADNAELATGLSPRTKSALEELGVPISTFALGRSGLKDLAIETVKVDEFAFVRNSITAEVEVHGRGFKGQQTQVVLRREGQTVASRSVKFEKDDDVQTVSFTFTPDQTGRFVYTVAVPVFPDEAVSENNTRSFALKVIRDRVRVLLVAGRPTWDERFLRGLLRQDPNVELISFYILRNQADNTGATNDERELSLIPFPMQEIFKDKLDTFDVVIFQNFGYSEPGLSISQYENGLANYVKNGGALLLIGGDRSFSEAPGRFGALADALPVEAAQPADVQPFKARITPEGLRHPVTALGGGTQSSESAWTSLPPIPGANMCRVKPGASVLLEHPFASVDGRSAPLLALWDYGRGRSMAVMTDGSWYWAFAAHAQGAPSHLYERFWSNALRWLVRDPDLTTLQVVADPPSVEPGKPVAVVVTARMPDYQPAVDAHVKVDLVSADDGHLVASKDGTTSADGVVRIEFAPPAPGPYRLIGRASKGEKSLGEGQDAVAVRAVGTELADAHVGTELLKDIAKATGGKAFTQSNPSLSEVPLLEPPLVEVGRAKDQPVWDRWYWLAGMVFIIGLEWLLRRRFGYI
jgi:uncharacterized membrane protein